jgi:hypothetical protein
MRSSGLSSSLSPFSNQPTNTSPFGLINLECLGHESSRRGGESRFDTFCIFRIHPEDTYDCVGISHYQWYLIHSCACSSESTFPLYTVRGPISFEAHWLQVLNRIRPDCAPISLQCYNLRCRIITPHTRKALPLNVPNSSLVGSKV